MSAKSCPNCQRSTAECASEGSQECWRARCITAEFRLAALALAPDPRTATTCDVDPERVDLDASPRERVAHLELVFSGATQATAEILRIRAEAQPDALVQARLPMQYRVRQENLALLLKLARQAVDPVEIMIHCPMCHTKHIDEGEFGTKIHHTHACQGFVVDESGKKRRCGHVWRPALVATVGVEALPGFINEVDDAR